jgi:hypothetical protein
MAPGVAAQTTIWREPGLSFGLRTVLDALLGDKIDLKPANGAADRLVRARIGASIGTTLVKVLPYGVTLHVPKIRLGGYIFIAWRSDHPPRHVHVYQKGRLVVKWDLENKKPMKGKASAKVLKLIEKLEAEGRL